MHPFKHFVTITRHRHKVMRYCFRVGIGMQGLLHDLSKYSFTEFWLGAKYYTGYCSPNAKERERRGYSKAWLHHKGRNKHHFEYWSDIVGDRYKPVQIPIHYLKESLCDRVAASKIYLKKKYTDASALEYYDYHEANRDLLHEASAKVLRTWLCWIKEFGQKKAFQKIKQIKSYEQMEEFF